MLCCLPTEVVSIVSAAQVNEKLATGDVEGAVRASSRTRTWLIVTVVAGLVAYVIYFVAVANQSTNTG